MRLIIAALMVLLLGSIASAQVIYLPVQYQYGRGEQYYYGGSDPHVFAEAERVSALRRLNRVDEEPVRVYTDLVPFWNATLFGFGPTDARNEAYQAQSRYFRKGELLEDAFEVNGTIYVPPAPPTRYATPLSCGLAAPAAKPDLSKRGVIIIIPKQGLERREPATPVMFVAAS